MQKELYYLRFVQIVISINTLIICMAIYYVLQGQVAKHKKLMTYVVTTTLIGVFGLVLTVFLGWDYSGLTSPLKMLIHRSFSSPLLVILVCTAYYGFKENKKVHRRFVLILIPFWLGTLITGIWFF